MKKYFKFIYLFITVFCLFSLMSCSKKTTFNIKDSTVIGNKYQLYADYECEMFDFKKYIECNKEWYIAKDKNANEWYLLKEVELKHGDNKFYIFVEENEEEFISYEVNVRRLSKLQFYFEPNGGKLDKYSKTVQERSIFEKPTDPIKNGYVFTNWYYYDNGQKIYYDFSKPATKGYTLYAEYETVEYPIIYHLDGGFNNTNPISYNIDSSFTLTEVYKDGYTFEGWYLDSKFTQKVSSISDNYGELHLYAKYTINEFYISYELNGGKVTTNKTSYNKDTESFTLNNPTKEGYEFLGWKSNLFGENLNITIPKGTTGHLHFEAIFRPKTYKVTFSNPFTDQVFPGLYVTYDEKFELPYFEREGYYFNGWYYNNVVIDDDYWNIDSDVHLIPKFTVIDYNIIFNLNGGTLYSNNHPTYNINSQTFTIPRPIKTGSVFLGWTDNYGNTDVLDYTIETGTTGDLILTANWHLYTGNIKFVDENNNEIKESLTVQYGDSISLEKVDKAGYTFNGWYLGDGRLISYFWIGNNNDTVVIVGKFTPIQYTITYDLKGGTNDATNPKVYNIESDKIIIKEPKREGYYFTGWKVNGSSTVVNNYVIEKNSIGDISLEACWETAMATLKFTNTGDTNINDMFILYNMKYSLPTPTKEGYYFLGWYSGTNKVSSTSFSSKFEHESIITLEAKWELTNYHITYNLNGGTCNPENLNIYDMYTDDFTLNNPTKIGFKFIGWKVNGNSDIYPTYTIDTSSLMDYTFEACYEANEYTVSFSDGDKEVFDKITVEYGSTYELPTYDIIGYKFLGWYYNDTLINSNTWNIASDVTLTSKHELTKYKITYLLNGGSVSSSNPNNYYYTSDDIKINNPTKSGYEFIGWTMHANDTPVIDYIIKKNSYGDITLTANYEQIKPLVTFLDMEGNVIKAEKVSYNGHATAPAISVPNGYFFDKWDKSLTYIREDVTISPIVNTDFVYTFDEENEYYYVSGQNYKKDQNGKQILDNYYVLPEYNGYKVFAIDNLYYTSITEIIIPEGIKYIYSLPRNITNIVLPDSAIEISLSSSNFKNLTFNTYNNCNYLPSRTNPYFCLLSSDNYTSPNLVLHEDTIILNEDAFYDNDYITNVEFPDKVKYIGNNCFSFCDNLTDVYLNEGLIKLGDGSFRNTQLTSINLPISLEVIGKECFDSSNLSSINIPKNVREIGEMAFFITDIATLTVDSENMNFASVDNVLYSKDMGILYYYADDKQEKEFTMPDTVKEVKTRAISNNYLTSLTLSKNLEKLAENSISCSRLTKIEIFDKLEFYEPNAIYNCTEFIVSENNPYFKSIDGVLYSKDGTKLIQYPNKCTNTSFVIPNSVITIGENAFYDATKLTSITLTNNITTINAYAFSGCRGIKSIIIPESVNKVEKSIFYFCSSELKIYCKAASKPEGWSSNWYGYPITESNIVWGY